MNPAVVKREIDLLRLAHPELVEDEDAWTISVESETKLVDVLRQIERRRQEAASLAGAIAENIAALEERQKRFERREQAMRKLGFNLMQTADVRKMEMPEATYSIRNGQQKLLGDANPADLPGIYTRTKIELDKTKIKEALQAGQSVDGFNLSNAEPSLSIRTK